MIVAPLKSNIRFSLFFLILIGGLIWISTFSYKHSDVGVINYKEHVLYDLFFDNGYSFFINQIITLLVVLLGAVLVNFLAIEQEIVSKTNYLPSFFYVLFAFSANTQGVVEPILVANLCVIPALYYLINSYRKDEALKDVFKSALLMGLASFFCIHYIVIFPISYVALFILRPFNWRESLVSLLGLVLPLYLYVCLAYLITGHPFDIFNMMQEAIASIHKPFLSKYFIGFIVMILVMFFLSMLNYLNKGFGNKVKTQKSKHVLLWLCLFCGLIVFFEQVSDMILLPCIIPFSILISDYLAEIKQIRFANFLVVMFILSFLVIYFHALNFIS